MTTDKKPRQQTAKGFMHKASGKVSAAGFLAAQRAWLLEGERAKLTSPILARIDAGDLLPSPGLALIATAVMKYDHEQAELEEENKRERASHGSSKPIVATVYDAEGEILTRINEETGEEKQLIQNFEAESQAQGWADRRLFEEAPGSYAILIDGRVSKWERRIERDASSSRIMKEKRGPVMTHGPAKSAPLGSRMKVSPTHFRTSAG